MIPRRKRQLSASLLAVVVLAHPDGLFFLHDSSSGSSIVVHAAAFYMHRTSKPDFVQTPSIFEDEPVVVEEVLDLEECETWLSHILRRSKNEMVQVQVQQQQQQQQQRGEGSSWRNAKLSEATDLVVKESSPSKAIYVQSTKSSCSTDQLPFYDLIESLFDNEHTECDDTLNWFSRFAPHAHIHDTLVVAGRGASSSRLQCHPFTKMSLCLDGSQLWRIVPPRCSTSKQQVPQLSSSAKASPIWNQAWEGFSFSTGYQAPSDANLFAFSHQTVQQQQDSFLVNYDILDSEDDDDEDEEDDEEETKYDNFQQWAEDPTMLLPNMYIPLDDEGQLWHSTVTLPGDLIVIPPGWWYQSYNLEPSMSIESQRCGGSDMANAFLKHILKETFGTDDVGLFQEDDDYYYNADEAQVMVDRLFGILSAHYQGVDAADNSSLQ